MPISSLYDLYFKDIKRFSKNVGNTITFKWNNSLRKQNMRTCGSWCRIYIHTSCFSRQKRSETKLPTSPVQSLGRRMPPWPDSKHLICLDIGTKAAVNPPHPSFCIVLKGRLLHKQEDILKWVLPVDTVCFPAALWICSSVLEIIWPRKASNCFVCSRSTYSVALALLLSHPDSWTSYWVLHYLAFFFLYGKYNTGLLVLLLILRICLMTKRTFR